MSLSGTELLVIYCFIKLLKSAAEQADRYIYTP
jgi:hypothetical protein